MVDCNYERKILYFYDEVNDDTVGQAIKYIHELEKEFKFYICSGGGEEKPGIALYDELLNRKVTAIANGAVESMALIIYLACERRLATNTCIFMNHKGNGNLEGSVEQCDSILNVNKILENRCNNIITTRTKLTPKENKEYIKECDFYFNAIKAKKMGFVHKVIK